MGELQGRVAVQQNGPHNLNIVKSPFSEVTIPNLSVDQLVWQNIENWEDSIALECGKTGRRISYKELRSKCKSLASNLASLGLSGGTALLVLSNCPEYAVAILGSLEAGMTVSAVNPLYTPGEIKYQSNDSGAKIVFTTPDCLESVRSANLGIPIVCTGDEIQAEMLSFNKMTDHPANFVTPPVHERIKHLAFLLYSSGTTGLPKGVKLSHQKMVANLVLSIQPEICVIKKTTDDHQDTLPSILPFFHIYGMAHVLLRGLILGAKMVTLPNFDAPAFLKILCNNKDLVLLAVPPIIGFLAHRPEAKPEQLVGLRHTVTAAAPCRAYDIQKLKEKKDHPITQVYGLTESTFLTSPPLTSKNYLTVGNPAPNTLGCVIDPVTGKPLPPGSHGEVCFKGPQIMDGYHNKPEATAEMLDSNGWIHTGDIGYTDEQGQFYIIDRFKEIIKVKGYQVAPAELEALLNQHPSVFDVGVTGVPSHKYGEVPVAFIVPKPGHEFEENEVLEWLGKQIAPYKKPTRIIIVTDIPKTSSGKILRRKLKEISQEFSIGI